MVQEVKDQQQECRRIRKKMKRSVATKQKQKERERDNQVYEITKKNLLTYLLIK